ncbi:MAG: hypothetical protein ACI9P5_002010 [Saprospiraceae bacterium]
MGMTRTFKIVLFFFILSLIISCDSELLEVVPDNESYSTTSISKIKIENYVNRLFIDIIGREPNDIEQSQEADFLNENDLSEDARLDLITRLMKDTTFSENEGSYQEAFSNNLYLLAKIRCIEGVSDQAIRSFELNVLRNTAYQDSLNQNWEDYFIKLNRIRRYELLLRSASDLQKGKIKFHEVFAYMIDNGIYDSFNMNAFNFIRASFDQLLFRLPTDQEFNQALNMVANQIPDELLGQLGNSKTDYINIMIGSVAMKEGMIRWAYHVFLQRPGTPAEIATLLETYKLDNNINNVIAKIVITDEYANFY